VEKKQGRCDLEKVESHIAMADVENTQESHKGRSDQTITNVTSSMSSERKQLVVVSIKGMNLARARH